MRIKSATYQLGIVIWVETLGKEKKKSWLFALNCQRVSGVEGPATTYGHRVALTLQLRPSLFWGWHVARVFLLPHSSVKAFQHSEVHRRYFSSKSFSRRKLNTFCGGMLSIRGAWWIKTWSEKFLCILSWKNMLSYSSGMRCDIKKLLSWRHSQVFHPCVRRVSSRRRVPERCRAAVGGRRGGAPFAIISHPPHHLTVCWASVTIRSRHTLWAGSSTTLNHGKSTSQGRESVLCVSLSKWNRNRRKQQRERNWHQIFPRGMIWLSNSVTTGVSSACTLHSRIHRRILWPPRRWQRGLLTGSETCLWIWKGPAESHLRLYYIVQQSRPPLLQQAIQQEENPWEK